jgi:trehalose/maltose hydrolase-like predicted phosphorylase
MLKIKMAVILFLMLWADEYAQHVDDNAFTNASAIDHWNTIKAATILNEPVDPKWWHYLKG